VRGTTGEKDISFDGESPGGLAGGGVIHVFLFGKKTLTSTAYKWRSIRRSKKEKALGRQLKKVFFLRRDVRSSEEGSRKEIEEKKKGCPLPMA